MADQSRELKESVMRQIQQEAAVGNARALIDAIQDNCFSRCVQKPGKSLSNTESTCYIQCTDKYLAAWNLVSSTLLKRVKEEGGMGTGTGVG